MMLSTPIHQVEVLPGDVSLGIGSKRSYMWPTLQLLFILYMIAVSVAR